MDVLHLSSRYGGSVTIVTQIFRDETIGIKKSMTLNARETDFQEDRAIIGTDEQVSDIVGDRHAGH